MLPPPKEPKPDHNRFTGAGIVFANELALDAIRRELKQFPEGSILVREKPSEKDPAKPELLAVMIKRKSGFNTNGGDWQFLTTNGSRTKIKLDQKIGMCLECHESQKRSDFVYPLKETLLIPRKVN
jgi:hypothetical protein